MTHHRHPPENAPQSPVGEKRLNQFRSWQRRRHLDRNRGPRRALLAGVGRRRSLPPKWRDPRIPPGAPTPPITTSPQPFPAPAPPPPTPPPRSLPTNSSSTPSSAPGARPNPSASAF